MVEVREGTTRQGRNEENGLEEEVSLSQCLDGLRLSVKPLVTWTFWGLDETPRDGPDAVAEEQSRYGDRGTGQPSIAEFWDSLLGETDAEPAVSRPILRALAFIHEHYAETILVRHMADRACMSRYHFIRRFKGETGLTPHSYLIELRLSHAKRLLLSRPDLKVREIGARVGYADPTAFTRLFRNRVSMSPQRYRESQLRLLLRRRRGPNAEGG